MIKEAAYAKINIALEVMEEENGYHKVNNLMLPISLSDEITFEKADTIYMLKDMIPDNICLKAANLFIKRYCIPEGVCINLNKRIPVMAGLAGGSSDAAAVLRGLNRLFHIHASVFELQDLAAELGSDVPFFIETKAALCTNRGETVNPFPFQVPRIPVLLIKPEIGLSTKAVYQNYVYTGISKTEKINALVQALQKRDIDLLKQNIFNDLTESALSLSAELRDIYLSLRKQGFSVYLSGSGPTLFLIDPTREEREYIEKIKTEKIYTVQCYTI